MIVASGPQVVIASREDWPSFFASERGQLEAVAGNLLLGLEHVGSTAVPGLVGKPVIDILASTRDLKDAPAIAAKLSGLGYVQIPFVPATQNAVASDRLFFLKRPLATSEGADPSHPGYNIHVVAADKFHQDEQLLFRNYLRNHPELVAEYGLLKCEIVGRIKDYREYMPAKSAFIEKVLASARLS